MVKVMAEFNMTIKLTPEGRDALFARAAAMEPQPVEFTAEWHERRPGWRGWVDWLFRRKPVYRRIRVHAAVIKPEGESS
jgi:hypothetical protein